LTQLEVETSNGPVHRLLAINDAPLDSAQEKQETVRLEELIRDPNQQLAVKKQYDADERRLQNLVRFVAERLPVSVRRLGWRLSAA
jgi:hypothetical protein